MLYLNLVTIDFAEMRRRTGVPEGESIYPYVLKYDPQRREEAMKEVFTLLNIITKNRL